MFLLSQWKVDLKRPLLSRAWPDSPLEKEEEEENSPGEDDDAFDDQEVCFLARTFFVVEESKP